MIDQALHHKPTQHPRKQKQSVHSCIMYNYEILCIVYCENKAVTALPRSAMLALASQTSTQINESQAD